MHYMEAESVCSSSFFISEIIQGISMEFGMGVQIKIYLSPV
jgi:hypothetical protein